MISKDNSYIMAIMRKTLLLFSAFFLMTTVNQLCLARAEDIAVQQQTKIIKLIEVKGNKSISTNTVISKMRARIGSPYQENVISDDLRRLYLLGFFSDIKIDTEDYKDGFKVIVTVVERPIIEKITFTGMWRITQKDEKIKEQLKSKETQYLDYPNLAEDTHILKKMYDKIGYNQAQINYQVDIDKNSDKAKIQFIVSEGKRIKVKDILVEGNKSFPSRRIVKLMKTKSAWLLSAGTLKDEVLEEDIERIKAFYRKEGFVDVSVSHEIKADERKTFLLRIFIKIQEGRRYRVGNVTVRGNRDIAEREILSKLSECIPGKVFSQEALKRDAASIQSAYFDKGYISAAVKEATSVNSDTGRVDILYNIIENEIAYVDKIRIRGNVKTKDVVIRRQLRIHPGDRFDGNKLKRSKERLQNLGFFEDISYDTEDTVVSDKKNLIVDVKETKTGAFSFGGGYSTVDQLLGFVEIEQRNFDWKNFPYFTGAGQDIKFRATLGSISSNFDLSFTEPWLFDYPVSFGFDAYRRTRQRSTDVGYGYEENVSGGDLRLGKEISEYVRGDLMYRLDEIEIKDVSADATADLKKEQGKNTISSMQFVLTYDSRDNAFDTKTGDVLSSSIEVAGGPFAGEKDYYKFFNQASHYFPMLLGSVLQTKLQVGLADAYGSSGEMPIYERFFAGGAYTIRGYHERKVGPIDSVSKDPLGGYSMVVGNIEYTYPLYNAFKLAAFVDTGNVWSKISKIGSGGLKSGMGLGLRLKTPIGPITLDYGIPLNKEPGEEKKGNGRFHFSASHGF